MNRKLIQLLLGLLVSWAQFGYATPDTREIVMEMGFASPEFQPTRDGHSTVEIDGLPNTIDAGLPSVPVRTLKLALPVGTQLMAVRLVEGHHSYYHYSLGRAAGMLPLTWMQTPPANVKPSAAPDFRGEIYPESRLQMSLQYLHGVPIAVIQVYPVTVNRANDTVDYLEDARVTLQLEAAETTEVPALRPHQKAEVARLVDNPQVVDGYWLRAAVSPNDYDYLILSTPAIIGYTGANGLSTLQGGLAARGLKSKIVDVTTLNDQPGRDLPEKIRGFIKSEYQASGIRYVLLAGRARESTSEVYLPARALWSKIKAYLYSQWTDVEENIPSDLYYSNLDGDFNSNSDDKWGEPTDGEGGGDVDFLPEVTVGRVPLDTTDDLQNFVTKTLWAHTHPLGKTTLLMGEELFPELKLYGDDYMDQLIGDVTEHGFNTKGYGTDWTVSKLYDKVKSWSGKDVLTAINGTAFGMVNHLGHSNNSYNMRLSSSSITKFTNANPFFFYTQGCLAGRFTDGSFVDKLVKFRSGAVAAIANTTYGLAPEDPTPSTTATPGGSQMLHRKFIHAVFSGENSSLGQAHQASKVSLIDLKSAQEVRWIDWSTTYFGDPSLGLNF